jgi:hypothetical protein
MTVTFQLAEVWKGPVMKTVDVRTLLFGKCGYRFMEGESYLVYANGGDQLLTTGSCMRTKPISEAISEVSALGDATTIRTTGEAQASGPIISFISPSWLTQYTETRLVLIGANFSQGAKVVFSGSQFQHPVQLDATFENPSILTVSSTYEPPTFPKEPLVNDQQSYDVTVKNPDGRVSRPLPLKLIGLVDMLDSELATTMSNAQRASLAQKAGLKVIVDDSCPYYLWYVDSKTNEKLNPTVLIGCKFRDGTEGLSSR